MPSQSVIPDRFYRIILRTEPSLDDFRSNDELGHEPKRPLTPQQAPLWTGLSVFETLEAARHQRSRSAWLGEYVAEIHLPGLSDAEARRTTASPGHWTLWLPADLLYSSVVAIIQAT